MSGRGRRAGTATGSSSGRTWTAAEAQRLLSSWKSSGESLSAFARRHGFSAQRLSWWRRRLDERTAAAEPVKLAPVVISATGARGTAVTVELGAVVVRVSELQAESAAWVAALATALSRAEP